MQFHENSSIRILVQIFSNALQCKKKKVLLKTRPPFHFHGVKPSCNFLSAPTFNSKFKNFVYHAFGILAVYPMYVCNKVGPNNFFVVRLSFYLHHLLFSLISKYCNITNWKYKVYFSKKNWSTMEQCFQMSKIYKEKHVETNDMLKEKN